jgi:hypothetical protein
MFFLAGEDVLGFAGNYLEQLRTPGFEMCAPGHFLKNV